MTSDLRSKIVKLFEGHCECRPTNTARLGHSHDCDDDVTELCRMALHRFVVDHGDLYAIEDDQHFEVMQEIEAHLYGKDRISPGHRQADEG